MDCESDNGSIRPCGELSRYPGSPVSYTHLRAHETPEHLVCRLLLEKKNDPTLLYVICHLSYFQGIIKIMYLQSLISC